ncbi:putative orofacial cleft 1 candidate gene 1 protein [Sciurus carolinensis]|uniref:Orofacial cleft 1 candidate gene 1 protein n=1 Tax=Sciurus carolinensis TaxID=30640 RepID=A0AA41NAC1_SCICA|nr:putative orofacial cleft 1 candidate gene 1 protein [Sciurus carolinensis]
MAEDRESYWDEGSISNKMGPKYCDLSLLKEDHELRSKGNSPSDHSMKAKSAVWRPGELEDYSQNTSYLEELEKHRFSVCCSSVAAGQGSGEFFKHLHFALVSVISELQLAQWQSQAFWYIILLMASLWFLRLYLHYLGQWLFLRAISTPVTKFHFYPHTVELCYPSSLLSIEEELPVVVVGPLMLNAIIFLLVLIRWGCQLLFASCLDALSKLIITMGLWTVLDPLAVFIVDTFLGRRGKIAPFLGYFKDSPRKPELTKAFVKYSEEEENNVKT